MSIFLSYKTTLERQVSAPYKILLCHQNENTHWKPRTKKFILHLKSTLNIGAVPLQEGLESSLIWNLKNLSGVN